MDPLSDRLIAARKGAGMTQTEAAEKSGVSRATIQNAEAGKYEMPTLTTLARLSKAYRVEVTSFLNSHGEEGSEASEAIPETDRAPIPTAATR